MPIKGSDAAASGTASVPDTCNDAGSFDDGWAGGLVTRDSAKCHVMTGVLHHVDVSGWQPDWLSGVEQIGAHAARLKELCGQRITHTWVVWDNREDEWFPDLPVVVRFEHGRQLEVCWQKFDDLSTTWNTINVQLAPAYSPFVLAWRPSGHPAVAVVVGDTLTGVVGTKTRLSAYEWQCDGIWLQASLSRGCSSSMPWTRTA